MLTSRAGKETHMGVGPDAGGLTFVTGVLLGGSPGEGSHFRMSSGWLLTPPALKC